MGPSLCIKSVSTNSVILASGVAVLLSLLPAIYWAIRLFGPTRALAWAVFTTEALLVAGLMAAKVHLQSAAAERRHIALVSNGLRRSLSEESGSDPS
jgi:hypothetical protein